MPASMTAFGRVEITEEWGTATIEIKTVNHRYLDITIRMPDELRMLESVFRSDIQQRISRGKIDCTLRLEPGQQKTAKLAINTDLAEKLINAANSLPIRQAQKINPVDILRWPEVIKREPLDIDVIGESIRSLLARTMDQIVETRNREGAKIREMVLERCSSVIQHIESVKSRLPEISAGLRARYQQRAKELQADINTERLEQELLLLTQKMDVAEELDRLEAHVQEVKRVLGQDEPTGRRLDFLMQEMNREANTLSSKSAHIDTTNSSVELKVLIEQMREQIQNVE